MWLCDTGSVDSNFGGRRRNSRQLNRSQSTWMYVFFFSSRRRHTRLQGDWSSDVCSSDLISVQHPRRKPHGSTAEDDVADRKHAVTCLEEGASPQPFGLPIAVHSLPFAIAKIGRASCRERV